MPEVYLWIQIQVSLRCPFKKNMLLEVIDKYRVSHMRVGKISEVVRGGENAVFDRIHRSL